MTRNSLWRLAASACLILSISACGLQPPSPTQATMAVGPTTGLPAATLPPATTAAPANAPSSPSPSAAANPTGAALPAPTLLPSPGSAVSTAAAQPIDQATAMLPETQGDLASLPGLPRYTIQVEFDAQQPIYHGHLQVDYKNLEAAPLDTLDFRLYPNGGRSYGNGSLQATNMQVNGRAVESSLSMENSALELKLAAPLQIGETAQASMDFSGRIPVDFGPGYGIFNFTEGITSLDGWFPLLAVHEPSGWDLDQVSIVGDSVYSAASTFDVQVTTASDQVVASTGVEIGSQAGSGESAGKTTRHFISGPARDFYLSFSSQFKMLSDTAGGTRINSYFLPKDAAGGRKALQIAVQAVKTYSQQFGLYPYREFNVVETPLQYASGVEFPAIVLIAEKDYADISSPAFTNVVAHEVAHQWWYGIVGDDVIDNPWMDEAMATYTSALYFQILQGDRAYQAMLDSLQKSYQQAVEAGIDDLVTESVPHFEALNNGRAYSPIVYAKGALFFHALRQEIGDQAFFAALRSYYQLRKYQIAAPSDLLNTFQTASGKDLQAFYQKWLYSKQPVSP